MTRPALRAAGALLFLSTLPAFAAVPTNAAPGVAPAARAAVAPAAKAAAKSPPMPKPSPTTVAITAALTEVTAGRATMSYAKWLDSLPGFRFSPATSRQLIHEFGTDQLFSVKRQAGPGGRHDYLFAAPALRHTSPDGSSVDWDAMEGAVQLQADGRAAQNLFTAPRVAIEDKTIRVDMRALTGTVNVADVESPYGDMAASIGSVQMAMKQDGSIFAMNDLFLKYALTDRGANASMLYETGMRTLTVQDERIDDLHLAMRVDGMDKAALDKLDRLGKQMKAQQARLGKAATPAQQTALVMPVMRELANAVLAKDAVIHFDDLSFAYRGNTARVHGEAHMDNPLPADLDAPASLLKKAVVHLDVSVPLAMLRDIAASVTRKQLAKQQPGADAATVAKAAAAAYDAMLRTAVASGFVRVEGDMLVTTVDVRDGVVLINGKPMPLPTPGAPVAAVDSGAGSMRARRIADKCKLPDYPADVVAQDRALAMAVQLTVNADGSVASPTLARSSGLPAYDQAVLAAAATCTYIPSLRNGKPVAVSDLWEIVRAPGSTRP